MFYTIIIIVTVKRNPRFPLVSLNIKKNYKLQQELELLKPLNTLMLINT